LSCVLCVVDNIDLNFDNQLYASQQVAIAENLPLAVVHIIDKLAADVPAELERLRFIEKHLDEQNTPLMILVGNPTERLQAVSYHLKPHTVVDFTSQVEGKVVKHPIVWPGRIISIDELLRSGFLCDE
jgi:hypothetical protein